MALVGDLGFVEHRKDFPAIANVFVEIEDGEETKLGLVRLLPT